MATQAVIGFFNVVATKYLNVTPEQGLGNMKAGQQPEDCVNADGLWPLHLAIIPIIAGTVGFVCVVLILVFGRLKARGVPISCWGLIKRVDVRMSIVYGLFRIISDLVKSRLDRIPSTAAATIGATTAPSPFPTHLPRYSNYSLTVLIWLAGIYGVFICDIGLGLYGSGETGIAETLMVLFAGFLMTFSYTNRGLNVVAAFVMVLTVVLAIMLYFSQTLDASLLPTTNGLHRRVVRLERVLISRQLYLPWRMRRTFDDVCLI